MALKLFKTDYNKVFSDGCDKINKIVVNSFTKLKNNKSKKLMCMSNIRTTRKLISLTFNAKKTFSYLKQTFIKTSILQYFDLKSHIWIKIDVLGYTIDKILSELNSNSNALLNNLCLNKSDFG